MARYRTEPERITLDGGLAELQAVRRARRKICTSRRYEYAWLRIDPCIELPEEDESSIPQITTSQAANRFLHQAVPFAGRGQEYFAVICLNQKNRPLAVAVPFKGGRNAATVDVSVVLQAVLLAGAPGFIIAHNHPSQDPAPSQEDIALTRNLQRAAKIVRLNLLDALVLTDRENVYSSFQDMGLMRDSD
jgi:DNA repair protein RadC